MYLYLYFTFCICIFQISVSEHIIFVFLHICILHFTFVYFKFQSRFLPEHINFVFVCICICICILHFLFVYFKFQSRFLPEHAVRKTGSILSWLPWSASAKTSPEVSISKRESLFSTTESVSIFDFQQQHTSLIDQPWSEWLSGAIDWSVQGDSEQRLSKTACEEIPWILLESSLLWQVPVVWKHWNRQIWFGLVWTREANCTQQDFCCCQSQPNKIGCISNQKDGESLTLFDFYLRAVPSSAGR